MNKKNQNNSTYKLFGKRLQEIRLSANKTVADVCGAVELETEQLKQIESGVQRPSEELVFLLANHFCLSGDETDKLFQLAGYHRRVVSIEVGDLKSGSFKDFLQKLGFKEADAQQILNGINDNLRQQRENPIFYTDTSLISVGENGVVIEFQAQDRTQKHPQTVARLGMSFNHASKLAQLLNQTLSKFKKDFPNSNP